MSDDEGMDKSSPHTGEVLDAMDALRNRIVGIAQDELGDQQKGSLEVYEYWRDVLPDSWTDAQVKLYAKSKSWCGGFCLWALHQAGIALDIHWQDGIGFVGPAKLPRTSEPKPGDIAYTHSPYQHHALVESCEDGVLVTIDGNTPGVSRRARRMPKGIVFYSIEKLLLAKLEKKSE